MLIQHQVTRVVGGIVAIATGVLLSASHGVCPEPDPKPIKVLIVDGFSNHDWRQTTRVVRRILEDTRLFEIEVSTTPAAPDAPEWDTWRPHFGRYDVVIQNSNNIGNSQLRWPKEVEVALENYVRSGGGLYISGGTVTMSAGTIGGSVTARRLRACVPDARRRRPIQMDVPGQWSRRYGRFRSTAA